MDNRIRLALLACLKNNSFHTPHGVSRVYNAYGINPETLTKFTGNPETARTLGSATYVFFTIFLAAPILEECIFRLGLSFRKWQIALASASIPAYILWQKLGSITFATGTIYAVGIIAVFCLIYCLTSDSFWAEQKKIYYRPMIWLTAIAFGLIHLIAFSDYSLELLPYMLCVINVPFLAGCAITYYRINLGFWWGVALHIFNNLPAIFLFLAK